MAYVRQRNKKDCGVAAVAMLCLVTYEQAHAAIPWSKRDKKSGTTTKQLTTSIHNLGFIPNGTNRGYLKRLIVGVHDDRSDVRFLWNHIPNNSLVKIPGEADDWHWVVWRKGKIYDPSLGVFTPRHYSNRFPEMIPTSYIHVEKKDD